MTIIGAASDFLWWRGNGNEGTMEALLATPVTKAELLVSKIIPYYVLGMLALFLCLAVSVFLMGVPFRGSLVALFGISTPLPGQRPGHGACSCPRVLRKPVQRGPGRPHFGLPASLNALGLRLRDRQHAEDSCSSSPASFPPGTSPVPSSPVPGCTVGALLWTNALGPGAAHAFLAGPHGLEKPSGAWIDTMLNRTPSASSSRNSR